MTFPSWPSLPPDFWVKTYVGFIFSLGHQQGKCFSTLMFTQVADLCSFTLYILVVSKTTQFWAKLLGFLLVLNDGKHRGLSFYIYKEEEEMRLLLQGIHPSDSLSFLHCSIAIHISPWLQWMYNQLRIKSGLLSSGSLTRQKLFLFKR